MRENIDFASRKPNENGKAYVKYSNNNGVIHHAAHAMQSVLKSSTSLRHFISPLNLNVFADTE